MFRYQTKIKQNAGFTLVEVMVVILIIAMLVALGNWWNLSQKREKSRLEELAVQLIAMIDQEKTNTLLGKTEWGDIVRKRKITVDYSDPIITYTSAVNLAKDPETDLPTTTFTKTWNYNLLDMKVYSCDSGSAVLAPTSTSLDIELRDDTMSFGTPNNTIKHIVIQVSRLNSYREIHIDRRTGVTYEREGASTGIVSCT